MRGIDIVTSVVGSYPLVHSLSEKGQILLADFREKTGFELRSLFDFLVAHAVIDQLLVSFDVDGKPGLDVIGTGQPSISVQGNMNLPYFELLEGISVDRRKGSPVVRLLGAPAEIDFKGWGDQAFFREVEIASAILGHCRRTRRWATRLRISLTGPVTLSCGIHEGTADEDSILVRKLSDALVKAVQAIEARKEIRDVIHEIVIDEPAITQVDKVNQWEEALSLVPDLVEDLFRATGFRISLHICGRINADLLRRVRAPNLYCFDLEVAHVIGAEPEAGYLNGIREIAARETTPRHWALGCVNVVSHRLESPGQIAGLCSLLSNYVDRDKLIMKPDCGLRGLSLDEARGKLHALCEAGEKERHRRRSSFLSQLAADQTAIGTAFDLNLDERLHGRFALLNLGRDHQEIESMQVLFRPYLDNTLIGPLLSGFTSHGAAHSRSVLHLVSQLTGEVKLTAQEERILYLAAYGHDIGLHAPRGAVNPLVFTEESVVQPLVEKYYGVSAWPVVQEWAETREDQTEDGTRRWWEGVRRFHGLRSALIVRRLNSDRKFLLDEELACFEAIAASHQTCSCIPSNQENHDLRTSFLCAILRVSDECDVSRQRIPTELMVENAISNLKDANHEMARHDAARAFVEYWKNDLIDGVWVDHRDQVIKLFSTATDERDRRLAESAKSAIEANLRVARKFLESGGISIFEVVVEHTPPSIETRLMGPSRFRLRGKGYEHDIEKALKILNY